MAVNDYSKISGLRRLRNRSPLPRTRVSVGGTSLDYPEPYAPRLNGRGEFSRGVRLEAARVKRGHTAPRFDGAKVKTKQPGKK